MQGLKNDLIIFVIFTTLLISFLAILIIALIYVYQKKKVIYLNSIETLKLNHENNILETQLEIQESTFQHISREIHDNINLTLTLAKLHLNTINAQDIHKTSKQIGSSIDLLTESIHNLSALSKSLNSDMINNQGLLVALEREVQRIVEPGLFSVSMKVFGEPVYMNNQKELLIFRIVQEAFNNIIKHAQANHAILRLYYGFNDFKLIIEDNGVGFSKTDMPNDLEKNTAGLGNMKSRAKMLGGDMHIKTAINQGTTLSFTIPTN